MEAEYSKRVYQGVRVKHTVKDLLAEKRSRQTSVPRFNAGGSPSQPAFVPMSGSHVLPGYYTMRRPFLQDSELCHQVKQYSTDTYSSTLGGKTFSYDHPSSYPFIDSYYSPESFDYRGPSAYGGGGGSIFPPSPLPPLLPPITGEPASSHLLMRDSWDPPAEDPVSQSDAMCSEGTAPVSGSPSLAAQDRMSTGRSQPYSLQPLEDVPYPTSSYTPASNYSCSPYMTVQGDLVKMSPISSEESGGGAVSLADTSAWPKDDGSATWLSYEARRVF
ncbi:uncharacterized protein C11orf53 homolog [Denticeps clupeoides]|uniref:OCA domain-containing protein n=1 Tax=Denticeps clupeoides TaxID=299321 RepID=A0AAY4E0X9_9TELE|nr:uncharacterized protein C11orf53 homolog [Denticeps clupeoides]